MSAASSFGIGWGTVATSLGPHWQAV